MFLSEPSVILGGCERKLCVHDARFLNKYMDKNTFLLAVHVSWKLIGRIRWLIDSFCVNTEIHFQEMLYTYSADSI